jgi:hypothetical protein
MQRNLPETIFHYCSVDTFHKIINSHSFWLSNNQLLNDFEENRDIDTLLPTIKELFSTFNYNIFKDFVNEYYGISGKENYVFCLSEKGDLLSQWRAYSKEGAGVSIGFNRKKLSNLFKINHNFCIQSMTLDKVIYNKEEQTRIIFEYCNEILNELKNSSTELEHKALGVDFISVINRYAGVFKNSSFEEEKEHRIIHHSFGTDEHVYNELSPLQFRVSEDKLIDYKEFTIPVESFGDLIDQIYLGPKCTIDVNVIQRYLNQKRILKVEIDKSTCTYR